MSDQTKALVEHLLDDYENQLYHRTDLAVWWKLDLEQRFSDAIVTLRELVPKCFGEKIVYSRSTVMYDGMPLSEFRLSDALRLSQDARSKDELAKSFCQRDESHVAILCHLIRVGVQRVN